MTTLDLGEPALAPLTLGREERVTLGARENGEPPDEVSERIALGRPVCRALDLDTVDAETRSFLQSRAGSTFWLLGLTCSFRAVEDEPLEKAWLRVELQTLSPEGGIEPLAWSMEPLSLSDPVQISRSTSLDASLKLKSELVPLEIGPSASQGTKREYEEKLPYVEAFSEGTASPSWIFSQTPITQVRGVHRLRAVIEMPAGGQGVGKISVGATLRLKLLGLVPYKAKLTDLPEHQSVALGAPA